MTAIGLSFRPSTHGWASNATLWTCSLLIVLFATGCCLHSQAAYSQESEEEWTYTFSEGDNLWDVTKKYLGGIRYWKRLQRLNNIDKPTRMRPGTQIRVPRRWLRLEPASAKVRDTFGDNFYIPQGKSAQLPLVKDALLSAGDEVVTSKGGNALLEFVDGSLLHIAESSNLVLRRVNRVSDTPVAETRTQLNRGRTEIKVNTKNTRFEITTPAANSVVRGTDFRVRIEDELDDLSHIEVVKGLVGVSGTGQTLNVKTGFGTSVERDMPPRPPVVLLPAPALLKPGPYTREFPVTFKWMPVLGAKAYRVQVRRTVGEKTVIHDAITDVPGYSTNVLDDSSFLLQVRGISEDGLEGLETRLAFELDAHPQPPAIISPGHEQVVRSKLPKFEWAQPSDADSFRFQLSDNAAFESTIFDIDGHSETGFTPEQLDPGTYYWRLASIGQREQGPYNAALKFTLRPSPDAPAASMEGTETELTIRWSPAAEGQSYRVQVSTDPEFAEVIVDEPLEEPQWHMDRPKVPFYFRVQIIDVDGFKGAWSLPQRIDPPPDPWYYQVGLMLAAFLILIAS